MSSFSTFFSFISSILTLFQLMCEPDQSNHGTIPATDMLMGKALRVMTSLFGLVIYLSLVKPIQASESTPIPESAYIAGFNGNPQSFGLSCESRSAADLAAFWGVTVSEKTLLNALPRSDDPQLGFVGDENGAWGYIPPQPYGVHAQPIANVLHQYDLQAVAREGMSWNELQAEIAVGRPVIVWIIGAAWHGTPQIYTTSLGKQVTVAAFEHTMVMIGYDPQNVTLVNSGDGKTGVYPLMSFLDSWSVLNNMAVTVQGKSNTIPEGQPTPTLFDAAPPYTPDVLSTLLPEGSLPSFPTETIIGVSPATPNAPDIPSFVTMTPPLPPIETGIPPIEALIPPSLTPIPITPISESGNLPILSTPFSQPSGIPFYIGSPIPNISTYTVQPGDYLVKLARTWRVSWQDLATLNGIAFPYQIYAGQVLLMPASLPSSP